MHGSTELAEVSSGHESNRQYLSLTNAACPAVHTALRFARHSRENGNPESFAWTPASAGVTTLFLAYPNATPIAQFPVTQSTLAKISLSLVVTGSGRGGFVRDSIFAFK